MKTVEELLKGKEIVREENRRKIVQKLLIELDRATEIMYIDGKTDYSFDKGSTMDEMDAEWALQNPEVIQFLQDAGGLILDYNEKKGESYLLCPPEDDEEEYDEEPDEEFDEECDEEPE